MAFSVTATYDHSFNGIATELIQILFAGLIFMVSLAVYVVGLFVLHFGVKVD